MSSVNKRNASARNVINVIFEAGRGKTENDRQSMEAVTGEAMPRLPGASRKGWRFLGWYASPGTEANDREKICTGDPVTSEEDLHVYARYEKLGKTAAEPASVTAGSADGAAGTKKKSMLRTQRIAILVMIGVVVLLAVSIPLIRHFIINVSTYVDTDGTEYTVKKGEGGYALFDPEGNQLERHVGSNELADAVYSEQYYQSVQNAGKQIHYFITKIGNQVVIDPKSGDFYLYAMVDTDEGEVIGISTRIMIYPQILQKNLHRLEIHNENGSYTVYTDTTDGVSNDVHIAGYENMVGMAYDPEVYANICVAGGYSLTLLRVDKATVEEYGYEEYGFHDLNGDGEATSLNYFTITERAFDERSGKYLPGVAGTSHTVYIGNATPTGGSRFIKLAGRKTVYVVSESLISALLGPLTDLVTPQICYPQSSSDFYNLTDFVLMDHQTDVCKVAFSYVPIEDRFNTLAQGESYKFVEPYTYKFASYLISSDAAFDATTALYGTVIDSIVALSPTLDEFTMYGLDEENLKYYLSFVYNLSDGYGATTAIPCQLLISEKTDGYYYVYSDYSNMIVKIEEQYLRFLEYRETDWVRASYFSEYISYVDKIELQTKNGLVTFDLNNDWTPLLTLTRVTSKDLDENGNLRDMLSVTDYSSIVILDKSAALLKDTYKVTEVTLSTEYCYYVNQNDGTLHCYTAKVQRETIQYPDSTGSTVTKTVVSNFTSNNDDCVVLSDPDLTAFARADVRNMSEYLNYRMNIGMTAAHTLTSEEGSFNSLSSALAVLNTAVEDLNEKDFEAATWREICEIYNEAYDKICQAAKMTTYTDEQKILAMRHILSQAMGEIDARVNLDVTGRMNMYFDHNLGMIAVDPVTNRLYSIEYNDSTGNLRVFGTAKDKAGNVTGELTLLPGSGSDDDSKALQNFRHFYQGILSNAMESPDLTEEQMEALKEKDDSECLLVLRVSLSDHAGAINPNCEEDNQRTVVYRFYQYSERRCYLTVDGEGESFILVPAVEKIIANAYRVMNGETIE